MFPMAAFSPECIPIRAFERHWDTSLRTETEMRKQAHVVSALTA